jgi:hypothetical protein
LDAIVEFESAALKNEASDAGVYVFPLNPSAPAIPTEVFVTFKTRLISDISAYLRSHLLFNSKVLEELLQNDGVGVFGQPLLKTLKV